MGDVSASESVSDGVIKRSKFADKICIGGHACSNRRDGRKLRTSTLFIPITTVPLQGKCASRRGREIARQSQI